MAKKRAQDDIDDILGEKVKKSRQKKEKLDDLLGPKPKKHARKSRTDVDDILGRRRAKAPTKKGMTYEPLEPPKKPQKGGIWERRASKGQNLGRTCLVCNDKLKYQGGRPPVICSKKSCFRAYRNMYRKDYDAQRSAA